MKNYLPLFFTFFISFIVCIFIHSTKILERAEVGSQAFENLEKGVPNLKTFSMKQDQLLRAIQEIQSRGESQGLAQDMEWLEKGPLNIGGRSRVVLIDQRDPSGNTVFAAGVSGGLWKTENFFDQALITSGGAIQGEAIFLRKGALWTPLSFDFPNLGICALIQDPHNLDVFYAGTGEFWTGSGVTGAGIWKSSDGGNQWEHLSSTANEQFSFINRLDFDQNGALYACTGTAGLMRSKNGGASWEAVLDQNSGALSNIVSDIEIAANGDIYASFGGNNSNDHIYKSEAGPTLGDQGNWDALSLPDIYQRKEIACSPTDSNWVYVLASQSNIITKLFISKDGGDSWTSKEFKDARDEQANYNMVLEVSKDDPNFILAGGIALYKSYDAGTEWFRVNVHVDQHFVSFIQPTPEYDKGAMVVNDGGVEFIYNHPNVRSNTQTRFKKFNYKTTQIYGLDIHPAIGSHEIMAGTQDNGVLFFNEPGEEVVPINNGDSGFPYFDQNEPQKRIINYKQNIFSVFTDYNNQNPASAKTISADLQAPFISPSDYDDLDNVLYSGTTKSGAAFFRIKKVFADNPIIEHVSLNGLAGFVASAVDISPNDNKRVYMGGQNALFRINNAQKGSTVDAELIFQNEQAGNVFRLRNIAIEKGDEDHMIFSVFTSDETVDYLWETKNSTDASPNWVSFQGDLPKMPVWWIIFLPGNYDQAMVGTEFGIWVTDDIDGSNTHWEQCKNGMPNVRVSQLVHRASDDRIVAATYGRGVFYTQAFEKQYAFFTDDSLHIKEADIFTETECRKSLEIDIPIELSQLPDSEVIVTASIDNEVTSALAGQDYEIIGPQSFNFNQDSPLRQYLKLRFFDDNVLEDIEQLQFKLSLNTNEITLIRPNLNIIIEDNELPIRNVSQESAIWEESWIEKVDFVNGIWNHSPPIRDLQVNQTQYNIWRAGEVCNPIDVFSASIWHFNAPEFRYICGYSSGLPSESIMYREVNAQNYDQLQVEFDWKAGGKAGEDYGSVVYSTSTDPFNWIALPTQYAEQEEVQTALVNLPDSLKDRRFQIGWKWTNKGQGSGQQGLAMSLDNIRIKGNLLPTRAENEAAQVSQFVGQHDEVLFFSERERLLAGLAPANNEPPGCTSIEVIREEGTSTAFENKDYTGFLLPVHHKFSFENAGMATGGLSLFFTPEDIEAFLSTHNISEDSLEVYFIGENNGSEILRIEDLIISSVALTKSISVNATYSNGQFYLGWLQAVPCTDLSSTIEVTICQGESFEGYSDSGTFQDQFTAANGCDSIRTLNLIVLQNAEETLSATICQGESFEGYSESGTFQDLFTTANGCDSIRTLNLVVLQNKEETLSATICQGESFEGYSESGTFQDLFTTADGCDSIRTLNLTVLEDRFALLNTTICEGEVFEGYSTTGVYQDQFTGANGCDSIRTLNLTVIPTIETTIDTSICSNVSFEGYSQTGTYQDVFQSAGGCDSVRILNLTVLPDTDIACQVTNTHEVSLENSIAIFPNPVTQRLQIEWTSRQFSLEFRLLDIRGIQLRKGILQKDAFLEVSELNRGMYYLQLTDGSSQVVKRFIKL